MVLSNRQNRGRSVRKEDKRYTVSVNIIVNQKNEMGVMNGKNNS